MARTIYCYNKPSFCACGCGEEVRGWNYNKQQPHRFIHRHQTRGRFNGHWNGGISIHSEGYRLIKKPDHPRADHHHGYVGEHVLVLEEKLGRYLTPGEEPHHITGKRDDNRHENLQLVTKTEHIRLHHKKDMTKRLCIICGNRKTYVSKKGYPKWYEIDVGKEEYMCMRCYRIKKRSE